MTRFFTEPQNISNKIIRLNADDTRHIRTLRLRPDEQFVVCDGNGTDYICQLGERDDHTVAEIKEQRKSIGEPSVKCRIFVAYQKGDRLDLATQKSVELGVHEIILFESERCIAVPNDIPKKIARLQRIAFETAKLCNRGIIPNVSAIGKFENAVDEAANSSDLTLFFYEAEEQLYIKDILEKHFSSSDTDGGVSTISIITGPEGGFEPHEVGIARSRNIPIVSLGPRILRSETAPPVALTTIMYQSGNL
ncbi:MAG: 16S rRNA (uracil(1498)-N(3))-methyltransferase [Oscillospiraceae bacterium]|nr:16S rRNA (uracil(1498)-N(3))-methyltransferase [Oscillospiraceae bacterium]